MVTWLCRAAAHTFALPVLLGLAPLAAPLSAQRFSQPTAQRFTPTATQQAPSQASDIDPVLARLIAATPAIDNHAHPMLSPPADATDRGFDALPVDNMEPQTDPVAQRPDWPALADAWRALYNFRGIPPLDAAGQRALDAARARVKAREGTGYSAWVLTQAGIGTMLANRVAMGTGVESPRFRWVPYVDALIFPLDNSALAAETPDRTLFFSLEDHLRAQYLHDAGQSGMPPTLDAYLHRVITPTLERLHSNGAVAAKFEVAYLRDFGFTDPPEAAAAAAYTAGLRSSPDPVTYKLLQDFLFRYIARECGRLGMPVHLHTMAGGGSYFSIAGGNPMLLEPLFNDPHLRSTRFVMLHGGWPYVHEIGSLLQKPNAYLDISQQAIIIPAHTLAIWLREWLELYPEKVLFGTDAYPYSPAMGWEESAWLAARNGRQALGLALTGMERDGELTPAAAARLAVDVLRGNAETLYGPRVASPASPVP